MTREQKKLLEPHAAHFEAMASYVRESSDAELEEIMDACTGAGPGNCAWSAYHAAQFLKLEVQREMNHRQRRTAEAAAAAHT